MAELEKDRRQSHQDISIDGTDLTGKISTQTIKNPQVSGIAQLTAESPQTNTQTPETPAEEIEMDQSNKESTKSRKSRSSMKKKKVRRGSNKSTGNKNEKNNSQTDIPQ